MKKLLFCLGLFISTTAALANHITGGEMFYVLVGQTGNDYTYRVTLKLYRDCFAPPNSADLDPFAPIAIFNNGTNAQIWNGSITMTTRTELSLTSPGPCIQNPPPVCYQVGFYEFTVTLPGVAQGYTIVYQRCCRITGINNLIGSSSVGATYTAQIPGTSLLATAPKNSSARFLGKDTVIVCANNAFCYDFGAADPDKALLGDSLSYEFCTAFTSQQNPPNPNPPAAPPFQIVPYASPYSSVSPLGGKVTLDPKTGQMCGIAPAVGIYVVTVCVTEWRNGVPIAVQKKDLQIKVGDCNVAASVPIVLDLSGAIIDPQNAGCKSYTFNFKNNIPPNPLVRTYYWEFGDGITSTDATPTHTYTDTGSYRIKLVINRGDQCSDSTTSTLKVYPGFFPGFTSAGICSYNPTTFTDTTKTTYGIVTSWSWDFGKPNTIADTSRLKNPSFSYGVQGDYNVQLIVRTDKGCVDTVRKQLSILDKPPINMAFRDTLICVGDAVQLQAGGSGIFSWTPGTNIVNPDTPDPIVNPSTTTKYVVTLNQGGCVSIDTVQVRVIDAVTIAAMNDTTICATDPVQLRATTNGLRFAWSPGADLNRTDILNPIARPTTTTTYSLLAVVGRCSAIDSVTVRVVPYPGVNAGPDTTICFNSSAQLQGSMVGSAFSWSPSASLNNPNSLQPVATPGTTTTYVLTVTDNIGCPKPSRDSMTVTVLPRVIAFGGRDTSVVVGQPLQFNATGGSFYSWSPATGLSDFDINNPVGLYDGSIDSIRYILSVSDENGCTDVDQVLVKVFKTNPTIFVPSAFTPNGDGKNDVLRAIPVGISKIDYFRVYNRWGQIVFNTENHERGWNGKIAGKEQGTGSYVWIVSGQDFTGKGVFVKGTVTLIR